MGKNNEMLSIVKYILSKPLKRVKYEDSSHCVLFEEVHPAVYNDTHCVVNVFGERLERINLKYTNYTSTQALNRVCLCNVFFSNHLIFDSNGNVYPDSFRFGPFSSSLGLGNALPLSKDTFVFGRKKRHEMINSRLQACEQAYFLDIAARPVFGHFLLETLSRLWNVQDYCNISLLASLVFPDYLRWILEKYGLTPTSLFETSGIVFCEKLHVHTQSAFICNTFHPVANEIYSFLHDDNLGVDKRVYLSRSRYDKRKCINESQIEDVVRKYGFEVVYPELLPIKDQFDIVSKSKFIVGTIGSQMHLRLGLENRKVLHIAPAGFPSITAHINIEKAYNGNFDVIYGDFVEQGNRHWAPWQCDIKNFEAGLVAWLEANS